jgi:hypothetical protein
VSEIRVRFSRPRKPAEQPTSLMQPMEPIALLRACAAHAGQIDPTAAVVLTALPDHIEAPILPTLQTP